MSNRTLVRYSQVREGDDLNDQHTAAQITTAALTSTTQDDLQSYILSQINRVIWGNQQPSHSWQDDFISSGIVSLADAENGTVKVPFTYQTASPLVLASLVIGNFIDRADISIEIPFNGVGATVQFGTVANPDLILGSSDVLTNTIGQYGNLFISQILVNDLLRLIINPAGSTQGAGTLFYKLRT